MPGTSAKRFPVPPERILAWVSLLLLLGGALGFELKRDHDADIDRVERKLDCALFQLPRGCLETMAPRMP